MQPRSIHSAIRKVFFAFLLSFSLLPLYAQDCENLIKNPSFEEEKQVEESGNSEIRAWDTRIRADEVNPDITAEFTQSKKGQDGNASARIEALADQPRSKALAEWWQRVPVKPDTAYYFSVYQRGDPVHCWAPAVLEELDSQKHYVSTSGQAIPKPPEGMICDIDANRWRLLEVDFITGPETSYLMVSLRLQELGGGWVEYDNAKLIELPNP